jgi:hypothetical protein
VGVTPDISTPPYRFLRFRFYTPKGVEDVRPHDGSITGRWAKPTAPRYSETGNTVAQRFANCGWETHDIIAFTKRFGPLSGSPYQDRQFTFTVESWRGNQWTFREFWSQVAAGRIGQYQPFEGSTVEIRKRWLDFRCSDLWIFMSLELLAAPEKLRFCLHPKCKHPYFVAQHGKERYCSTACANWSQAQLKKRWHELQRQRRKGKAGG